MPTLAEFDGIKICMYAGDHFPPHFHILHAGQEALVRISDLAVMEGALPRMVFRKALAWAADNQAALALRWLQLNEE
jgi:thiamine monophosphate kinase